MTSTRTHKKIPTSLYAVGAAVLLFGGIAVFMFRSSLPIPALTSLFSTIGSTASREDDTYIDPVLSFSFSYPKGASVTPSADGEHIVLIKQGSDEMQITVIPFDEDISLTPERIKHDIPDMPLKNVSLTTLAGVQTVLFETNDTREAWFVYQENLYQISELLGSSKDLFAAVAGSLTLP